MTNTNLLQAMGRIDPMLIVNAAPDVPQKKNAKNMMLKFGAMAACLCLMIVGVISIYPNFLPERPASMNLFGTPWVVADNSICIQSASYAEEVQYNDGTVLTPAEGFTFVVVECDLVLDKSTSIAECYIQKSEVDSAQYDMLIEPIVIDEDSALFVFSIPEKESTTTSIDRFCLTITLNAGKKTYSCDFAFSN